MSKVVLPIHGPDHCPGGPDPIPCYSVPYFRAWQYDYGTTIPDGGNATGVRFDRYETSDAAALNRLSVLSSPTGIEYVATFSRGLYLINFDLRFTTNPTTGNIGMAIQERGGGTYRAPPTVIHPAQPIAGFGVTGMYSMSLIRSYPPIWVIETSDLLSPDLPEFGCSVAQTTGASLTTFSAMFEVHRLTTLDYEVLPVP